MDDDDGKQWFATLLLDLDTQLYRRKKLKFVFVFHTATYYVNHIYEKLTHTKLTYVSKQIAF